MSDSIQPSQNEKRAADIRAMVDADFHRISETDNPFRILNLAEDADLEAARERFERYERFYRADNFRRFDDPDLTGRAQQIREAMSRAMVALSGRQNSSSATRHASANAVGFVAPPAAVDTAPLGDIYFRDGLTYLKLGDLNAAEDCLQRAVDHDPGRGILVAYLNYARYKLRNNDPEVVGACRENLRQAARLEPDNVEIFVIMARFGLNIDEPILVSEAIARIETLRSDHPKLATLRERLARLSAGSRD